MTRLFGLEHRLVDEKYLSLYWNHWLLIGDFVFWNTVEIFSIFFYEDLSTCNTVFASLEIKTVSTTTAFYSKNACQNTQYLQQLPIKN